jgi:TRAP-type C4-dicarboxylate transport system substrate-binding protein
MKQLIRAIAAFAALVVVPATQAFGADFRLLASWDKNYPGVTHIAEPFIKNVEAATKGRMKLIMSGPETVPPFEQLQPVGSGAFQFLFTHGAYHFGTTPFLAALEALGGDLQSRRAAGVWDVVDKHYQRYNLKLIALTMTPDGGYNIFTRQPIGPSGDLQGRKIRGTASYHSVFRMLGASPVVLPPSDIYTSLEKGVIDGGAWPVVGLLGYRWYEVAKYLVRPAFGYVAQPIFMNLAAWNKLSDADKKILLQEGRKIEEQWDREAARLSADEEKALLAKGMMVTQMGAAQKARLKQAWSDGLWELTSQKAKKDIDELRAFARSKRLAN